MKQTVITKQSNNKNLINYAVININRAVMNNRHNYLKNIFMITIILLLTVCAIQPTNSFAQTTSTEKSEVVRPQDKIMRKINANLRKWVNSGITNYQFDLRRNCFCQQDFLRTVTITVQNSMITNIRYKDTNEQIDPSNYDRYYTMEGIFAFIKQAVMTDAELMDIKYDTNFHFPKSIYIDYSIRLIDDEMYMEITNFTPLNNGGQM